MRNPVPVALRVKLLMTTSKLLLQVCDVRTTCINNTFIFSMHVHNYKGFKTTATEASMIGDTKVIVTYAQLQQLIPSVCVTQGCSATLSVAERFQGCGVVINMKCKKGHYYTWSSSPEHLDARDRKIYSNNLLMAAPLLTSGNSYAKIQQFCRFMGLKVITEAMYYR